MLKIMDYNINIWWSLSKPSLDEHTHSSHKLSLSSVIPLLFYRRVFIPFVIKPLNPSKK